MLMRPHPARKSLLPANIPAQLVRSAAIAVLILFAVTANAQPQEQSGGGDTGQPVPSAERREPWPLRPDPAPELDNSGCPAGARHLVRVGSLTLRLEPHGRWTAHPLGRREPTSTSDLPRCGDGRAIQESRLSFEFVPVTALPRDGWAAGVPPGPDSPACAATPEGVRTGRAFFALGLPYDIIIHERPARTAAASGEDDELHRLTIRRKMPLGNEELRAPVAGRPDLDDGYPTYRLPRAGEGAEALGPLLVECWGARWLDPVPSGRIQSPQICRAAFDAPRAGVRVRHRFPREVYNEPDWQALDLRVREWIASRTVENTPR